MKIMKYIVTIISLCFVVFSILVIKYREGLFESNDSITVHISIDDSCEIFNDLLKNNHKSIYDNYTFNYVKELHEKYGLKISFYVFYEKDSFNLSMLDDTYKDEFVANSDWMKFGFHAYNENDDYEEMSIEEFINKYTKTINSLKNVVGAQSIDYNIRLSLFKGNKEIIDYLSKEGIKALYTADDERYSYDLNKDDLIDDYYYNGTMYYIKTDIRLENTNDPFYKMYKQIKADKHIEIFTHEWLLKNGKDLSVWKIEEVCKFINKYKLKFSFDACYLIM